MQSPPQTVVILGTGGTIAGTSSRPGDNVGYRAAQLRVADLLAATPVRAGQQLESEQVAQIDSKDMGFGVWRALAQRCAHHLARPEVAGVVVTHGTDTMEETAYFLQRLLAPGKPLVLTGAMRPATALQSDGPQNLADAVQLAALTGARGVLVVFAGQVHSAFDVRKVHPYRIDAFASGEAGRLGVLEEGVLQRFRDWPESQAVGLQVLPDTDANWPYVAIVTSHSGADGRLVRALQATGVEGIAAATTGNGRLHVDLEAALLEAQCAGVAILRSTRCADGRIVEGEVADLPLSGGLSPVQARIELILTLLAARQAAQATPDSPA